jgi:hypothetical protein
MPGIPFLQLAGGVLLIWIAVRLARQPLGADGEVRESTCTALTLGGSFGPKNGRMRARPLPHRNHAGARRGHC